MDNESKQDEFLSLFVSNQKKLYQFILMLTGNYTDADDILQETASLLWSKFDEYQTGSNFLAWACTVARNKILNFRRKKKAGANQLSDQALSNVLSESKAIFDYNQERMQALKSCLLKLKEKDRQLVSLRYEQDQPVKQVASSLGRSSDGIYHTMARIHRILMECIRRTLSAGGII